MKKIAFIVVFSCITVSSCKEKVKNLPNIETARTQQTELTKATELSIIPIEHATMVIAYGDLTVYIDPVGGAKAFLGQKPADLILITDIHGDHFNLETLVELNNPKAKIIAPLAVAEKLPKEFTPLVDVLHNGDTKERFGISVEAVPMYNIREEALNFHPRGRGNGYVLNFGDQRLYVSGDTEDIPEMRALKNIDKAFICMNLPYTMTEESAAAAVLEFQPKQVYPYHYRGNPDVSDVLKFKELVTAANSAIEVIQLDWYPNAEY